MLTVAILASFVAVAAIAAAPRQPERLAAVFPPWWGRDRVMAAVAAAPDVSIAAVGGAPFILILRSDVPALDQRLRQVGALLLLDPDAAGVCGRLVQESRS